MSFRPLLDTSYSNFETLASAAVVRPYFKFTLTFPSTISPQTYVCETRLTGDSNAWLQGVAFPEDTVGLVRKTWGVNIATSDTAFATALADPRTEDDVTLGQLDFWFLNSAGTIEANGPYTLIAGYLDNVELREEQSVTMATLSFDDGLAQIDRAREILYTPEHQKRFVLSNDLGFDYVAKLQDWTGVWGKSSRKPAGEKGSGASKRRRRRGRRQ